MLRRAIAVAGIVCEALSVAGDPAYANDYPTDVVADYVIGCMVSNGESQEMLRRCSCSIDAIASILPYDEYEKAETVLKMQQVNGAQGTIFKQMQSLKNVVDQLRLAQIEADFRCF
jgi:hypothetical protein